MAERRALIEGVKPATEAAREAELKFVYGEKAEPSPLEKPATVQTQASELREVKGQPPVNRVHFTTRIRPDFAVALKRASLERQLGGQYPNTIQDFLEEALEPWLKANGYIE